MDHPLIDLIDQRIRAAEAMGAFDNLPGAGKPLPPGDDPENALINRLIRENGAVPECVTLGRALRKLREDLAATGDRTMRRDILKEMSVMEARIEIAKKSWWR
jgi:DnaJ homologue, subfamily C, member 28, conserved domain